MKISNFLRASLCSLLASFVVVGCTVDADDDPTVVTSPAPSSTTVIEDRDSPTIVTPPASSKTDVKIDTTDPAGQSTTTTTTGG